MRMRFFRIEDASLIRINSFFLPSFFFQSSNYPFKIKKVQIINGSKQNVDGAISTLAVIYVSLQFGWNQTVLSLVTIQKDVQQMCPLALIQLVNFSFAWRVANIAQQKAYVRVVVNSLCFFFFFSFTLSK